MSNMTVPGSGYSNRRSPGALAAAVALNGGLVALLIAIPITFKVLPPTTRITTYPVPVDPVPPPNDPLPPPKPDPKQQTSDTPTQVRPTQPVPVPPTVPIGTEIAMIPGPSINPGPVGPVQPPVAPPREPVFVRASQDTRFASTFLPNYPPALRRAEVEGRVVVRVTIDPRGRVIAVEQVSATDPAFFEATRRQALREWRFRPATRDGVPVQSELTLTVQFRLEN